MLKCKAKPLISMHNSVTTTGFCLIFSLGWERRPSGKVVYGKENDDIWQSFEFLLSDVSLKAVTFFESPLTNILIATSVTSKLTSCNQWEGSEVLKESLQTSFNNVVTMKTHQSHLEVFYTFKITMYSMCRNTWSSFVLNSIKYFCSFICGPTLGMSLWLHCSKAKNFPYRSYFLKTKEKATFYGQWTHLKTFPDNVRHKVRSTYCTYSTILLALLSHLHDFCKQAFFKQNRQVISLLGTTNCHLSKQTQKCISNTVYILKNRNFRSTTYSANDLIQYGRILFLKLIYTLLNML